MYYCRCEHPAPEWNDCSGLTCRRCHLAYLGPKRLRLAMRDLARFMVWVEMEATAFYASGMTARKMKYWRTMELRRRMLLGHFRLSWPE